MLVIFNIYYVFANNSIILSRNNTIIELMIIQTTK